MESENIKSKLGKVQISDPEILRENTNESKLPQLSVVWITSTEESLNLKTYNSIKKQSIAAHAKYILYDKSKLSKIGEPNTSDWLQCFNESFKTVVIELNEDIENCFIYNDARQFSEKSGFVLFIESGDSFPNNYFKSLLQGMKRTNPSHTSEEFYLIGITEKKWVGEKTKDIFSSRKDTAKLQNIDFASQYGTVPYFMAGTLIDAEYFISNSFREDLKYEYEKEYLLRLITVADGMRLIKTPLYTYHNPKETNIRLFPGFYEKEWYYQSIDEFWIPFMAELKEKYENVPIIIQYMAYYALCVRADANLNNRNKHCIDETDAYKYICSWSRLLYFIDDEIILNAYKQSYITDNIYLKRVFLRIKYQDEKLQFDTYYMDRKAYVGRNNTISAPLDSQSVDIQLMECNDGVLHIDALLSGIYDLETGSFSVKKGETEYPIEYNERYAHTKLFGITVYKRISFEINIPIDDEKKQRITFSYTNNFGSFKIPLTFGSHSSKLSKRFKNCYWYFESEGIRFMAAYDHQSLLIEKCGKKKQLLKEWKLRREMLKTGTKKAKTFLLVRTAYFFFRPFLKKRTIWLFLDKIYKGGDSSEYIYKYAAIQKDGIDKYYLIDKNAPDFKRLKDEGFKPLVRGSLKHRLIFLYADLIIMSNSTVCEFNDYSLDNSSYVRDLINFHGVCVQHGMSVQKIAAAQNRLKDNLKLYFCASKYEIENLNKPVYDYLGRDVLKLTGVPRYDGLINEDKRQILISPTWRMQAALAPAGNEGVMRNYNPLFKESSYFKIYNSLINDPRLIDAAKKYNYRILYVLHPIVSPQATDFEKNDYVEIVPSTGDMSYEQVFRESSLMVTDYSGVQFDFAYMRKPVIYLHHEDMPAHYEEGTYHYDTMSFGEICKNNNELIETLISYMKQDCRMKPEYIKRADDFFEFNDQGNCKRIYDILLAYSCEHFGKDTLYGLSAYKDIIHKRAIEGTLLAGLLKIKANSPKFLKRPVSFMDGKIAVAARKRLSKISAVKNDRIFIMTYDSNFICNPKYIAEEIIKRELPVEIIWGIPKNGKINRTLYPANIKLVRRGTSRMFSYVASSKIWIDNALEFSLYRIPKKNSQIYMNTWHGSLGIKRLSGDENWMKRANTVKEYTDYCITNSSFEENIFRTTFWPETSFLKYGHARNDIFFHQDIMKEKASYVRDRFNLPDEKKIFLYAPTFREKDMNAYESVNFKNLKEALEAKFGGDWIIMVRWHHKERQKMKYLKQVEWVIDASNFGDMQELLPAVDIGMTDYSSWVYDFVLTGRPIFLYAPDISEYDQARGFYYPLESTPFSIAHNNQELSDVILKFDARSYQKNVDKFLADKGCYECGNAAVRIVDAIEALLSGNKPEV